MSLGLSVDLNADVGEGIDATGDESQLIGMVTTIHVACGFHAGDDRTMAQCAALANRSGVALGAHPSYRDRAGFGRQPMDVPVAQVADEVAQQVQALRRIAQVQNMTLRSVKAHGSLYWRLARDIECAQAVTESILAIDSSLAVVLAAGSDGLEAVRRLGARVVAEGFCDRAYLADGSLSPRDAPDALITEPSVAAQRALSLVADHRIIASDGSVVDIEVDTVCIHGDTPGALAIVGAVRALLEESGVVIAARATQG